MGKTAQKCPKFKEMPINRAIAEKQKCPKKILFCPKRFLLMLHWAFIHVIFVADMLLKYDGEGENK